MVDFPVVLQQSLWEEEGGGKGCIETVCACVRECAAECVYVREIIDAILGASPVVYLNDKPAGKVWMNKMNEEWCLLSQDANG